MSKTRKNAINANLAGELDVCFCFEECTLTGLLTVVVVVVVVDVLADTDVSVVVFLKVDPIISDAIIDIASTDKYLGHCLGKKWFMAKMMTELMEDA